MKTMSYLSKAFLSLVTASALTLTGTSIASANEVEKQPASHIVKSIGMAEKTVRTSHKMMQLSLTQIVEAQKAISAAQQKSEVSKIANKLRTLTPGQNIKISSGNIQLTIVKNKNGYVVEGIHRDRSVCGWSIAVILCGIGSVALFALAAALGPGEVAVIAGVEMTAEQLGYAASASGGMAGLAAWANSKFCS